MHLPLASRQESPEQDDPSVPSSAIVGVILASLLVLAALYVLLHSLRLAHPTPTYIPTRFLKNRWRAWKPKTMKRRLFGFDPGPPTHRPNTSRSSVATGDTRAASHEMSSTTDPDPPVNRNTSIRSVITLPAYNPSPSANERLIAREGERGGVDTVVEYPETLEEEEARREADMDTLYQIRLARRRENEERDQRRRERQAAREAGDWARLEQLRLQARNRARARADSLGGGSAGGSEESLERTASAMLAEHASRASSRERRVSSVSYAELGFARHDGSRLRADSVESDHRPLLAEAAGMGGGGSGVGSRRSSLWNVHQPSPPPPLPSLSSINNNQRAVSRDGSFASNDSEADTPYTSTHGERSGSDPPMLTPSATQASISSQEGGGGGVPPEDPPQYEDPTPAPPYTSPVRSRGDALPQLPAIETVPAIEVEGATPVSSVADTPVDGHEGAGVSVAGRR
ncbi:MAG: hypothetical protein Q9214_003316 [Letrouitia sp. 1 TL-2023]